MPGEEKPIFAILVSSDLKNIIVPFEEPDIVELPHLPPKTQKEKGTSKNTATPAFSHLVTRSVSKTHVQPPTFIRIHFPYFTMLA